MAYIIAEPCVGTCDTACVEVCPVDCIHPKKEDWDAKGYDENNLDEPNPTGYYQGWGPTSQDVAIPAFMSAYLGIDPSTVPLDVFKAPVAPNWRITYDGLSKIPSLKKTFKRFNLSHSYRSSMSTSYTTNLQYEEDENGLPTIEDNGDYSNWISQRQFNTVSISEQLSPLIGLDISLISEGCGCFIVAGVGRSNVVTLCFQCF